MDNTGPLVAPVSAGSFLLTWPSWEKKRSIIASSFVLFPFCLLFHNQTPSPFTLTTWPFVYANHTGLTVKKVIHCSGGVEVDGELHHIASCFSIIVTSPLCVHVSVCLFVRPHPVAEHCPTPPLRNDGNDPRCMTDRMFLLERWPASQAAKSHHLSDRGQRRNRCEQSGPASSQTRSAPVAVTVRCLCSALCVPLSDRCFLLTLRHCSWRGSGRNGEQSQWSNNNNDRYFCEPKQDLTL